MSEEFKCRFDRKCSISTDAMDVGINVLMVTPRDPNAFVVLSASDARAFANQILALVQDIETH